MEKKSIKNKILAGMLAFILSGSITVLAKGEERTITIRDNIKVTVETSPFLQQLQRLREYEYVLYDESGNAVDSKWICSEELEWDGYKKTDNSRVMTYEKVARAEDYVVPVEEDYYIVYYPCSPTMQETFSEDQQLEDIGVYHCFISKDGEPREDFGAVAEAHRTPLIVKMLEEEYNMLKQLGLMKYEEYEWGFDMSFEDPSFLEDVKEQFLLVSVEIQSDYYLINEILTDNPYQYKDSYPYVSFRPSTRNIDEYVPITDFREPILIK